MNRLQHQDSNELALALARPDAAALRDAIGKWYQYYDAAFYGGKHVGPPADVSPELEPPDFDYFNQPSDEAHDHIMACMMIVLADYEHEEFIIFWAWGAFWNMLHDASDTMLARIENESRRTPRFRWMIAHLHVHAVPHVQKLLERASQGAPADGTMPTAPWTRN